MIVSVPLWGVTTGAGLLLQPFFLTLFLFPPWGVTTGAGLLLQPFFFILLPGLLPRLPNSMAPFCSDASVDSKACPRSVVASVDSVVIM